ncbi:hypothetical protein H5410_039977 [Solanum commersonii]|uniref:SWIM-type domain-containing protein n=1 Tax=Solanum commersonii TaxID=4109 RepID=A0A9J5XPN5_SOLCO|nr:hypothetical protein H5410_039977 [Solanum commersonii]
MKECASTEYLHRVINGAKRFTVCLNTRMCSCERFQHDEISCSHAVATRNNIVKITVQPIIVIRIIKILMQSHLNNCLAKAL